MKKKKSRIKNERKCLNAEGEQLSLHMKYAPSSEQMENAERDPVAALMTLATNTGLGRFQDTSKLIDNWSTAVDANPFDTPLHYVSNVGKEIAENLTEQDNGQIVKQFLESWNIEAALFACGSCGIKAFEMGTNKCYSVPLTQLNSLLISDTDKKDLLTIPSQYR